MKLLITFGAVCAFQIVTVSSVFFPVPIITGTTSTSSSGQPTTVNTNISFQNVSNITDMVIYLTQNISRAMLTSLPTPDDIETVTDILDTFSNGLKSMISETREEYGEEPSLGFEWITDESSNNPNYFQNMLEQIQNIFHNLSTLFNQNFNNQKNKEDTNNSEDKTDDASRSEDTSKLEEKNVRRKRGLFGPTNFNLTETFKIVKDRIDNFGQKLISLFNKPSEKPQSTNETNSDTKDQSQTSESQSQATNNSAAQSRRKRDLFSSFMPKVSAGLSLITNPQNFSGSASADSQASPPDQSLLDVFLKDITEIGAAVLKETVNAMNEGVKQMAIQNAAAQGAAVQNASQQQNELIKQEINKTIFIQQYVNATLNKINNIIETLAQKIKSSNCIKQFTDMRNLLSEGITCVKNKFDTGMKTFNDTLSNISDAIEIPWDIQKEVAKCTENEDANTLSKILCYALVPLQLEENKIFLPIEFGKRIAETIQFFATLRMDLIKCGIITIQSIAYKAVDCGKEAIIIGKDTILENF
uniref:56.6 kDa salivary protein n=1 Tax=Phlebotomus sergenti TaxID=85759 RepID=F6K8T4_9DIPT